MEHVKRSANDIYTFFASNILYIIWFMVYIIIAWLVLGGSRNALVIVVVIYGASMALALSPIGEILLRLLEQCREPQTQQEKSYLLPIFEEVYESAREVNPSINKGIKIYIMDAMYVNAFAIGRQTVAVTKGALETFTADELKGLLAHELGHMTYGHTKALLLSVVGNLFFSLIVCFFRLVLNVIQFISNLFAFANFVALGFALVTFFVRVTVDIFTFVFIHLSQIILALNSRSNEIQADKFAHDIGYGSELICCMYLLQKISMNTKMRLIDRAKATHPHLAYRISRLETLENMATEE